ncbi:hypothetical protein EF888_05920 [Silicimonas algicola]|uniref:hypothetical protein n=1 Tax=Silicimonas algicola TaxID=1826607 RepID=UPI000F857EF9|nr:hypothetical protein [Silicimonas algicola]AZQ66717.1 hypothetical protein EF888_05920 [Silicimonas algicola]
MKLYRTLDPSDVDLSFAGRLHDANASLGGIERLRTEDALLLVLRGDRWLLTDRQGTAVFCLAKKFAPPAGANFLHGSVHAISMRVREDSAEEYHGYLRRETWSVVLPEPVFEPVLAPLALESPAETPTTAGVGKSRNGTADLRRTTVLS